MKISSSIDTVIVAKFRTDDLVVASSWEYPLKYAQCCDSPELSIADRPPCPPRWSMPSALISPSLRDQSCTLLTPSECEYADYS